MKTKHSSKATSIAAKDPFYTKEKLDLIYGRAAAPSVVGPVPEVKKCEPGRMKHTLGA